MAEDSVFRLFYGADLLSQEGYAVHFVFFPAKRLMLPREQGMLTLAGLVVCFRLRWPWGRRGWRATVFDGDWRGWRWPVVVEWRSDVGEIATRLAEAAGWEVRHG